MSGGPSVAWPDGDAFAFTIFDDVDLATVPNVAPVHELVRDLGPRTTKSVWAVAGDGVPRIGGSTCDDDAHRAWTLELQAADFEIGFHGAAPVTSPRPVVARSLDRFRQICSHDLITLANHAGCGVDLLGEDRVSGGARLAFNVLTRFGRRGQFRGHREGDPLFWSDLCRERIRYAATSPSPT